MRYMNGSAAFCYVLAIAVAGLAACSEAPPPAVDGDFAFVNVNVIPMDGERELTRMTVVVDNGVIASIAPSDEAQISSKARVIDGTGRYLIPGLADMHVHIWDPREPQLYIAHGVTTVRNMWGEATTLAMREKIRSGEMVGPRMITAGRIVDGAPKVWQGSDEVADEESARKVVKRQVDEGFDFIKVYSNLGPAEFNAIVDAAREDNIPFAGHTPIAVGLSAMLKAGPQTVEHLTGWGDAVKRDGVDLGKGFQAPEMYAVAGSIQSGEIELDDVFDPAKRAAMAQLSGESRVWNVPTLIVLKQIRLTRTQSKEQFARPEMGYVSPGIRDFWNPDNDFRKQEMSEEQLEAMQVFFGESLNQVQAIYEAGAPILVGTDAPNPFVFHGLSVHEELELLVDAGIPAYAALEAATASPARFFGEVGEWGIVAEGARADLVLLSASPLDDISNTRKIDGVMHAGEWRDRATLDELLDQVATVYASSPAWFEGRDSLSAEFGIEASELIEFRFLAGDTESGAERMTVVRSPDTHELVAQGEFTGFVNSKYSIRRWLNKDGAIERSIFRQTEVVPAREIVVECTTSTCALRIDGELSTMLEGDDHIFFTQGPSDTVVLSSYVNKLEEGQRTDVSLVWLESGPAPSLGGGLMTITREADEAVAGVSGTIDTMRYELRGESDGFARLWVEADTGLPVRIERVMPNAPLLVWERTATAAAGFAHDH